MEETAKVGRPNEDLYDKYIKGREDAIVSACRNGATVEDLCRIIGCGKTVFHKVKKLHPEFASLLKESKEEADLKVENALFKRACGFEYEEVSTEVRVDPTSKTGTNTYIKKTKKVVPPDTGAAMAWLKNRRSSEWKDRHDVDMTVNPFLDLMKAASIEEKSDS